MQVTDWFARWAAQRAPAVPAPTCSRSGALRLTALLTAIYVMSLFDLAFTNAQLDRGHFAEVNAVAATVMEAGHGPTTAYKMFLLTGGVLLLYACRKSWLAEAGAWGLLCVHVGLMAWWMEYVQALEICLTDVAVTHGAPLLL
jgi:hypothetical protein